MKRRKRKKKHNIPKIDRELNISSVILQIYLAPLAKIALFLWLMFTGKILAGCVIYLLFGLAKLYYNIKYWGLSDNWVLEALVYVFLWPAIDIYSFILPGDNDFEQ